MSIVPMLTALLVPALIHTEATKPISTPAGAWSGAIQIPGTELGIQVELAKAGAWSGRISIPAQDLKDFELAGLEIDGERVAFGMPGIPGAPTFKGRVEADGVLRGTFTQGGQSFPFSLHRESVPTAVKIPPQLSSSQGREVSFAGFNAFPLKGSVLAGGAHAYFAVMVAGSGPTDRDWASSVMAIGHGGRDFALWLKAKGIGSLRYDKRFIGSKDPKLDISLDAQVGDIQAALRAAKALPEAKGKKLLLIGHSEGALLSLITGKEADAMLLLGLPGQSMAMTIHAQIAAQLPPETKAVNLEFVDAMLDAVRTGMTEPPEVKTGVFPGIANLAKTFMRPETAGFVRSTLDLEPLAMAERIAMPMALVWGDKDVQTWKPEALSESLKTKTIELKDANHLLKKETRPKAELSGANAMSAYNDEAPMADLSPLAAWLEKLK